MSVGMWRDGLNVVSDLGVIEHTRPRPHVGEVGDLMLIPRVAVDKLLKIGPNMFDAPAEASATVDGDRTLVHLDWDGQRWTWEVFDAHWTDKPRTAVLPMMIGKAVH